MARFLHTFPFPPGAEWVGLGEGGTPLAPLGLGSQTLLLKCEHVNPTGSFKDRGTSVLVSALKAAGVAEALEDSSGNAGASFAAYAAHAGIRARVFIPDSASGVKRRQIEAYGARPTRILGPRSNAALAAARAAEAGGIYASHAHLPHGLAGMATVAFEIFEQLGQFPGSVIVPVGQGTLLLGLYRGFRALESAGLGGGIPQLVGVQARACAPIWAVQRSGAAGLGLTSEQPTIAEGIRILRPLRGDLVLRAVEESGGWMEAVEEEEIRAGWAELARRGFFVEPTSAVVLPAFRRAVGTGGRTSAALREPAVAVLTGSGYKHALS
jgi:threonine synthase